MTSAELKHRVKLQEWAARIQECRSSGLSVRAWCRQEEINAATYYRWERELLALAETEPCSSVPAVRFAEFPAPKQVSRNVAERSATDVDRDWRSCVQQQKQQKLEQIIAEEKLKPAEAQRFVANAFRDGALKTTGTDIDQILPPVSRFGGCNRTEKKKTIIQRLAQFFEKYFGI